MISQCGLRNYLRQAYGERTTKSVLNYFDFSKKHANLISQQEFLQNCRFHRILPKSLRFRLNLGTQSELKFSDRVGFQSLNHILKDHKNRRFFLSNMISRVRHFLQCNLSSPDFQQISKIAQSSFHYNFFMARTRLSEKFVKLQFEKFKIPEVFFLDSVLARPLRTYLRKFLHRKKSISCLRDQNFACLIHE